MGELVGAVLLVGLLSAGIQRIWKLPLLAPFLAALLATTAYLFIADQLTPSYFIAAVFWFGISAWRRKKIAASPRPSPPPNTSSAGPPPSVAASPTGARPWHEVLEVEKSAPWETIRAAYLRLAADYHPDKVAAMPIGFQEFAAERMKAINAAYDSAQKQREARTEATPDGGAIRNDPPASSPTPTARRDPPAPSPTPPSPGIDWVPVFLALCVVVGIVLIGYSPNSAGVKSGPAAVAQPPATISYRPPPAPQAPLRDPTVAEVYDRFGNLGRVPIKDFEFAVCSGGYRPGPNSPSLNVTASIARGRTRRIYCKCAGMRLRAVYDLSDNLHLVGDQEYAEKAFLGLVKDALAWPHQTEIDSSVCVKAINNGPMQY